MVWYNESNVKNALLHTIKRANSGKGWILQTDHFDAFIWNSDKLLNHLLSALSAWVDLGQGKSLKIEEATKEKRGFTVVVVKDKKGTDVPEQWRHTENGFTCNQSTLEEDINPFV